MIRSLLLSCARSLSLLAIGAAVAAPSAGAAAGLPATNEEYVAGGAFACKVAGGGGRDRQGVLYAPCTDTTIAVRTAAGVTTTATVPVGVGGVKRFVSVAPTPDGSAIYTVARARSGAASLGMSLQRLKFNAARTALTLDPNFVPQKFTLGGRSYDVCGYDIVTDAYGFIYVSQGGWCSNGSGADEVPEPNLILKYAPNGRLVTWFGEFGQAARQLRVNMKLAVTPDGRRVYVAEHSNTRIQYFDWTVDGTYRSAGSFSSVRVNGAVRPFSATYGVALDPWGFVYVADTTAATIWKLRPDGSFVAKVVTIAPSAAVRKPVIHALSVDGRGNVLVPEAMAEYRRAPGNAYPASVPSVGAQPVADLAAPILRSVQAPERTTESTVSLSIDATDDTGVTEVRFADEGGEWGGVEAVRAAHGCRALERLRLQAHLRAGP